MNAIAHHMSSTTPESRGSRRLLAGRARPAADRSAAPRPAAPVRAAVVLIGAAAILELAVLITVAVTRGSINAAVLAGNPHLTAAQLHRISFELTVRQYGAGVVAVLLARLAWANGRGQDWARLLLCAIFALSALSLLGVLADSGFRYAPAAVGVAVAVVVAELAAVFLVFTPAAARHYRRPAAQ